MKAYVSALVAVEAPESLRADPDQLHGEVQHRLDAALEMADMKLLEVSSVEVDMDSPSWHKGASKKEADSNPAQAQAAEALKVAKELSNLFNMLAGLSSRQQITEMAGLQNLQESMNRLYEYAEQMRAGQVQQLQMAAEYRGWDPEKLMKKSDASWGADPGSGTPFSDSQRQALVNEIEAVGNGEYRVTRSVDGQWIVLCNGVEFALVNTLSEALEAAKADYAQSYGQQPGDRWPDGRLK